MRRDTAGPHGVRGRSSPKAVCGCATGTWGNVGREDISPITQNHSVAYLATPSAAFLAASSAVAASPAPADPYQIGASLEGIGAPSQRFPHRIYA